MQNQEDILKYIGKNLSELLDDFEARRLKYLRMILTPLYVIVPLWFVILILPFISAGLKIFISFFVLLFVWFRFEVFTIEESYYTDFKINVITKIISYFTTDYQYSQKSFIKRDIYVNSGLHIEKFHRLRGSNHFAVNYKHLIIHFSLIHAQLNNSEGNRMLSRNLSGTAFKGMFGFIIIPEHYNTENITNKMIKEIKYEIQKELNGEMQFVFKEGDFYFRIDNPIDLFAPKIFKKINSNDNIIRYFQIFDTILNKIPLLLSYPSQKDIEQDDRDIIPDEEDFAEV